MELIGFLGKLNVFLQILVVLVFGIYLVGIYFLLNLKITQIKNRKEKFHNTLLLALQSNSINSIDDIFNIYKGINEYKLPNDQYRTPLNNLLRAFLTYLYNESEKISNEEKNKWKDLITKYIRVNEETSPFSNLPDAERNIMNDILAFLEYENKSQVKAKIKELAGYIQSKSERLTDLERKYKNSNITAIVGLILTVIFGVASILLSL